MEKEKIRYKDLSNWLKAIVVAVWVMGGIWAISFLVGFIQGIAGYGYY
jgi:hypothetical protein